ncbi:hypothetical protein [Lewinella cohaerens]|uniref:hypothetical protein n=1 Tax=Lewinella cohaerens TaxID=70995 RepID=UPI00037E388E|nr:hypothetical protein [Lewinella cohaerens]
MKNTKLTIILFSIFIGNLHAQNQITFQVDLTNEESVKHVGVRGGLQPLSWSENSTMHDIDGDGIYTLTIEFPDSITEKTLEYKFLKDDIWERQDTDNRKLVLTGKEQIIPISKWKIHSDEYLFNNMSRSYFGKFIFIFHSGKKQGKTPKEIVLEMIEYYNWSPNNWPSKPNDLLEFMKSGQEGHKGGYFEVLEDEPNKIKCIIGRYWIEWFDLYGPGLGMDKNGIIQGVTKDDLETYYVTWIEHFCSKNDNNWKFQIVEQGESKWVVTISDE